MSVRIPKRVSTPPQNGQLTAGLPVGLPIFVATKTARQFSSGCNAPTVRRAGQLSTMQIKQLLFGIDAGLKMTIWLDKG